MIHVSLCITLHIKRAETVQIFGHVNTDVRRFGFFCCISTTTFYYTFTINCGYRDLSYSHIYFLSISSVGCLWVCDCQTATSHILHECIPWTILLIQCSWPKAWGDIEVNSNTNIVCICCYNNGLCGSNCPELLTENSFILQYQFENRACTQYIDRKMFMSFHSWTFSFFSPDFKSNRKFNNCNKI